MEVTRPYHKDSSSIRTVDAVFALRIATTQVRILCSCPCVSGRGSVRGWARVEFESQEGIKILV